MTLKHLFSISSFAAVILSASLALAAPRGGHFVARVGGGHGGGGRARSGAVAHGGGGRAWSGGNRGGRHGAVATGVDALGGWPQLGWPQLGQVAAIGSGRNWSGRNWSGRNWNGRNWNNWNNGNDLIFIGSFGFPWGWGWGYPYGYYGGYPYGYGYGSGYGYGGYPYGYGYGSGYGMAMAAAMEATNMVTVTAMEMAATNMAATAMEMDTATGAGPELPSYSAGSLALVIITAPLTASWDHRRVKQFAPTSRTAANVD